MFKCFILVQQEIERERGQLNKLCSDRAMPGDNDALCFNC